MFSHTKNSGGEGVRTPDPRLAKPMLSQLSYTPMVGETGFEPATLWSQTRCATRLRHFP